MNACYYYSTCQIGAEKAVKSEVLQAFPELRFAFSRPGFITFKQDDDQKPVIQSSSAVFTRAWGRVLSQTKDESAFLAMINLIPEKAIVHVFERDQFVPGDEPETFDRGKNAKILMKKIPTAVASRFRWNAIPKTGEDVYDLIWVDDFHIFLGTHRQSEKMDSSPGNIPTILISEKSPSRAYLKIAEAVHRFQPPHGAETKVLEVGCSPGGATTFFLEKGMKVTGIDPKRMDEKVDLHPHFHSIRKIAKGILSEDLQGVNPDWMVMDMNIAPLEAIDELTHVLVLLRKLWGKQLKIKQGFLTIKLNDWKFAESIPLYLKRLEECGFRGLTPIQLATNRQEFFVYAKDFKV